MNCAEKRFCESKAVSLFCRPVLFFCNFKHSSFLRHSYSFAGDNTENSVAFPPMCTVQLYEIRRRPMCWQSVSFACKMLSLAVWSMCWQSVSFACKVLSLAVWSMCWQSVSFACKVLSLAVWSMCWQSVSFACKVLSLAVWSMCWQSVSFACKVLSLAVWSMCWQSVSFACKVLSLAVWLSGCLVNVHIYPADENIVKQSPWLGSEGVR